MSGSNFREAYRGTIPKNLKWSEALPPTYQIGLFKNKEKTRTIIVCFDTFGGGASYAEVNHDIPLIGKERQLESDEQAFIGKNYPVLLEKIQSL